MATPTTVPSASATIEPGRLVGGRYLLLARAGRGGSGSVWRAHDELLHRDVAVKRLPGVRSLDAVRSRMVREQAEGRLLGRLHHPRLAAIYDLTEIDGEVCLVMEYVAAPSLAELLHREGPLPAARVAAIGAQLAEGLAAMHRCGIVHRDVKPSNIMIGPDDTVTITDFGIAIAGLGHQAGGTPHQMAPELARGEVPTAAADMFSLGATLRAMLEGGPPARDRGDGEALDVLTGVTADVGRPTGDAERLNLVLRDLLDHDPQRRPSAAALAGLLGEHSATSGVADAHPVAGRSAAAEHSGPSGTATLKEPTPGGDQDTAPTGPLTVPWATFDQTDDQCAALPGRRTAPAHGVGRHRAALAARWRPSRRALAVGAGLAGVLGAAAIVTQPTVPDPPPAASPAPGAAAAPPPATAPPTTSATANTMTSTPVEQVASAAPSRSHRSRPATAEAPSFNRPGLDQALAEEALGDEPRSNDGVSEAGEDGGDDGTNEGPGTGHGNGHGNGHGHGD